MLGVSAEVGTSSFFARQFRLVLAIMLGVVLFQTTPTSALTIHRDYGSAFSAATHDVALPVRSESAEVSVSAPVSAAAHSIVIESEFAPTALPDKKVPFPRRQTGPPTPPPRSPQASPRAPPAHP